CQQGNSLPWTF
nr:immunoglobulin light chain junction region [Mus musculus]NSL97663.1 immunoglobulin light chain junction region [Mus musculus]NSL99728.1 immunoglobulin light chain junction region [Mus musculus]NSM02166.1 immunoglobulin light chain junction region [Mus musculus]